MNRLIVALAILCTCVLTQAGASADVPSLRLCYENREQPPYYLGDSIVVPSQRQGIYVDILSKVTTELGIGLQWVRRPWKRCLRLLELNEVDGVLGASFLEERKAIGRYPIRGGILDRNTRLAMKSYSFYAMKGNSLKWTGELSALRDRNIGVPLGYAIRSTLIKAGVTISEQPHTELLFEMLRHRRIEAVATIAEVGDFLIQQNPGKYKDVIKLSPKLQTKAYYLLISRGFYEDNQDLAWKIWNQIPAYRSEVSAKYGVVD